MGVWGKGPLAPYGHGRQSSEQFKMVGYFLEVEELAALCDGLSKKLCYHRYRSH